MLHSTVECHFSTEVHILQAYIHCYVLHLLTAKAENIVKGFSACYRIIRFQNDQLECTLINIPVPMHILTISQPTRHSIPLSQRR